MTTERRPEEMYESAESVITGAREVAATEAKESVPPQGLSDEEKQQLKERAQGLVAQLVESSGGREMEMADGITSIGIQSQRKAGTELDLLKGRMGQILDGDGPGAQISRELVELRLALDQINPHHAGKAGFAGRLLGKVPMVGDTAVRTLERIAIRYEPVSRQVALIETRLRDGRALLVRDNVELRKLYEQVEERQLPIRKNAYVAELVMQKLSDTLELTEDPLKKERIRNVLHDVAMRVQDLRTIEEVHIQFFVSIEMTRQNNSRLGQSVERTLALGANVVTVGLALQVALVRERAVMRATQRTREFLGDLILANAETIKSHADEIGDVYNSPVIALEKIAQAHDELIEAMNTADRLKQEGIEAARENIARLTQLSVELEQRSRGLSNYLKMARRHCRRNHRSAHASCNTPR